MSRRSAATRARRRVWLTLVLSTALAAVWFAAWGLQQWAPFAHEPAATEWPANVRDLADFVEGATGQQFQHVLPVHFATTDEQFRALVGTTVTTDAQRHLADTQDAVGRALGLWNGGTSTLQSSAAMDAAPSAARWLPDSDVLVVRAGDGGTDLSAYQRSEVVLQLTLALDEQHYHLVQRRRDSTSRQQAQALGSIGIGHAVWVHDVYYEHLDIDEQTAYSNEVQRGLGEYETGMASVPPAFTALRMVGQRLGPTFITVVLTHGRDALAQALGDDAPDALDQVDLPSGKFVRLDRTEHVDAPPVPWHATKEFSTQAGPFLLFMMVSNGMVSHDALTVSDGWGNDAYTVYQLDGRVCLDLHVVADTSTDADDLQQGLSAWARTRPAETDALVARRGNDLYATACDPGTEVLQTIPDPDTIDQYFARTDMIREQVRNGTGPGTAECIASTFFGRYSLAELRAADAQVDVGGEVQAITAQCRALL